jgi:hypothetical protein
VQMHYEGGGTAYIYHATVHGYLVREEWKECKIISILIQKQEI